METFQWRKLSAVNWEQFGETRTAYHHVVQYVAAVGRRFSPRSRGDIYATLSWVPGLSRLAGNWVKGDRTFRSSISFNTFSIFLVDEKVITLSEISLQGITQRQLMLWLEEQIGKFGLQASNLAMNLPYEIESFDYDRNVPFDLTDDFLREELGRYFHNAYITIREIKQEQSIDSEINIWPHHFDLAMDVIVKDSGDPETTSKLGLGMYPGDPDNPIPYFYVNTWPHAEVEKCDPLTYGTWVNDAWAGAFLSATDVIDGDQKEILSTFYREASEQLKELLVN